MTTAHGIQGKLELHGVVPFAKEIINVGVQSRDLRNEVLRNTVMQSTGERVLAAE